jgi:hypothetical protein
MRSRKGDGQSKGMEIPELSQALRGRGNHDELQSASVEVLTISHHGLTIRFP